MPPLGGLFTSRAWHSGPLLFGISGVHGKWSWITSQMPSSPPSLLVCLFLELLECWSSQSCPLTFLSCLPSLHLFSLFIGIFLSFMTPSVEVFISALLFFSFRSSSFVLGMSALWGQGLSCMLVTMALPAPGSPSVPGQAFSENIVNKWRGRVGRCEHTLDHGKKSQRCCGRTFIPKGCAPLVRQWVYYIFKEQRIPALFKLFLELWERRETSQFYPNGKSWQS